MKLSEYKPSSRIFALFIGRSSSGKSSAAATFPSPKFMDFDGRIRGTLWTKDCGVNLASVDFDYYPPEKSSWASVDSYLEKLQIQVITDRMNAPQTLIPDSVTTMLRVFMNDAMDLMKGNTLQVKMPSGKDTRKLRLEGISDYKFESNACFQIFDTLRSLPINVIVTAHIIPRYGKPDGEDEAENKQDAYKNDTIIGEKLSIRDKLGENLLIYFDEVYRFERREVSNGTVGHFVKFHTDMARTTLGFPPGEIDITGKNFYRDIWLPQVESFTKGE